MIQKLLEVRDEGTCIPVLAIKMVAGDDVEWRYLRRCGYPSDGSAVILMELNHQRASVDPYEWGGRTYPVAHNYIYENFDRLKSGDVVDVRVVLGETTEPAKAEI